MKRLLPTLLAGAALALVAGGAARAQQAAATPAGFRHVGSFVVRAQLKITDDRVTRVPIKPILIDVFTNGVELRMVAAGRDDASPSYQLYRSDGIGRLNPETGVLEVIPGLQGSSCRDGILRHARVTREALTLTQFAGVSNQTLVTHAVAAPRPPAAPDEAAAHR